MEQMFVDETLSVTLPNKEETGRRPCSQRRSTAAPAPRTMKKEERTKRRKRREERTVPDLRGNTAAGATMKQ